MTPNGRLRANLYLNYLVVVLAFSIPLYREWVSITVPIIMILWLFDGRLRDKLQVIRCHTLSVAVLLFFGFNLLSVLWSTEYVEGFIYVDKYRYLWLIPVIATALRQPFRRRALAAFLIGTSVSLVLSYAVFFDLFRIGSAYPRNPSPTMNHLDFSMVLAFAALVAFNRLVGPQQGWRNRVCWTMLLVFIVGGLFINIGKSGQLAFIGTLVLVVPLYVVRKSRRAVGIGLAVVLASVFLASLSIPRFNRQIESAVADLRNSLIEERYEGNFGKRIAGGIVALDLIRERPLLGTGVGDNMVEFRRVLDSRYPELRDLVYWFPHLHNQYLQVATEIGIVGLLGLAFIFYGLFRGPYRSEEDRNISILLGCVFLLGFMGDPFLHKQLPMVLFAAMAGIVSADGRSVFWQAEMSETGDEPASSPHAREIDRSNSRSELPTK